MRLNLAVQVLSEKEVNVLSNFHLEAGVGTGKLCLIMDKFFDCLNASNTKEDIAKWKPFLRPYKSTDDVKFVWLYIFLNYFRLLKDWKIELKKGITLIEVKMQSQESSFCSTVTNSLKLMVFISKKYVHSCCNKVFHVSKIFSRSSGELFWDIAWYWSEMW